ncbi:MAG: ATP-binding protein, partial [Clostridia bacterium]
KITGIDDVQLLQKKVVEHCEHMEPTVRPVFSYAEIDNKTVVSIEIGECDIYEKPCFYRGKGKSHGSYIRVGEADNPMSEFEIYTYEVFKRNIQDEIRVIENSSIDEINQDKIESYFIKLKECKPNLAKLSLTEILNLQNIVKTAPTLIGFMLFGKYPQTRFPQLGIIASVVAGDKMGEMTDDGVRFFDDKRIEGTIPEMLDGAMDFIKRNMKKKVVFDENSRRIENTEYPILALREAILNALVHRDYSIHTENCPIQILMFSDRIEISNPGGLYGRTTIDQLGKMSLDVRNPYLASALEILISSENRYSGIPTIRAEMNKFGLIPPVFESERGYFKTTLFNTSVADADMISQIIDFCKTPKSREEIANKFNVSSVAYFITRYIWPLLASGRIKETMPDKPKSKNQKFYSVY